MNESQRGEYSGPPPEDTAIITVPVARNYTLLAGVVLTCLGILGLVPALTEGVLLLGVIRVTAFDTGAHLITGLAGLAAWSLGSSSYACAYAIALAVVYFVVFTMGNPAFGNQGLAQGVRIDLAWIITNGFHVTLMLVSLLVAAAAPRAFPR